MILRKLHHHFFTLPLTRQINIPVSSIKTKASSLMLSTSFRDMMCMQECDESSKRKEVKITLLCLLSSFPLSSADLSACVDLETAFTALLLIWKSI